MGVVDHFLEYIKDKKKKEMAAAEISLKTEYEMAHFVRCIPFRQQDSASNASQAQTTVWTSPEFLTLTKLGDIPEHALLLASLFMGLKREGKLRNLALVM